MVDSSIDRPSCICHLSPCTLLPFPLLTLLFVNLREQVFDICRNQPEIKVQPEDPNSSRDNLTETTQEQQYRVQSLKPFKCILFHHQSSTIE